MVVKRMSVALCLLISGLLGAGAAQADLVGWWKLDGNALDSSGKGHNGVLYGDPGWVSGVSGQALKFDGVDDRVEMPGTSQTDGFPATSGQVTWTMWIKATPGTGIQTLLCQGPVGAAHVKGNRSVCVENTGKIMVRANSVGALTSFASAATVSDNQWHHVAVTLAFDTSGANDSLKVYVDGDLSKGYAVDTINVNQYATAAANFIVALGQGPGPYMGTIDDVQIYDTVLSDAEIQRVMKNSRVNASNPSPADSATDVSRDVLLNWSPGNYAGTHDVYLGTSFADVNVASRADAKGVLAGRGQTATTYNPGRLAFGVTYYWRVDEVNASPEATAFKGAVWSFATEPVGYPVDGATITATASSAVDGQGPENTISGSGLTNDLHAGDLPGMWLTAAGATGPAWIQFAFAQPLKLHEMWVWNHNGLLESMLGFGAKDVTIEYSADGTTFQALGTTHQFTRAPGQPDYAHNTVVDFGGAVAKYVKLTITSNWGGMLAQYGLSEVRFFAMPMAARQSTPAVGATGVSVNATLSWRPGREAAQHQVFLGTDPNKLSSVVTVNTASYSSSLNVAGTYYWRVDEVNATKTPSTWSGPVWSFSTEPYVAVDDFEAYTDDMDAGKAIFQTWADGFGTTTNGSVVGNDPSPFAERTTVHAGKQSMPLMYNNTSVAFSEATRTFATPQDWTQHGVKGLTLWFYGAATNVPQQLYVKINSTKIPYDGDAANLKFAGWQMWYIDLSGKSVSSVKTLSIGLDRLGGMGGQGRVLIDDLRLYSLARSQVLPVAPAATGLQVQYQFEGNANDSSDKGRNGALQGGATFAAGKSGQAVSLDGIDDYVSVTGYKGIVADAAAVQQPFTVCAWIKTAVNSMDIIAWGTNVNGQRLNFRVDTVLRLENGSGNIRGTNGPSLLDDEWHHVAATLPLAGTLPDVRLYVDGRDVSAPASATATFNLKANVDVSIGNGGPAAGRFFKGLIDDARIYDRVLSVEEIAGLAGLTVPYDKSF